MKFFVIFYFFFLLFLSCNKDTVPVFDDDLSCQGATFWDFPMIFETEERVQSYQIPEEVLQCLSTAELTDLCLRYPLLDSVFTFNHVCDGLDWLFSEFNGISELFKRKEVASCLVEQYNEKVRFLQRNELSVNESYFLQIPIIVLDALFSRVTDNEENMKDILRNLYRGYEVISMIDIDNTLLLNYNYFSRTHVIINISDELLDDIPQGKNNPIFAMKGADCKTAHIINRLCYRLCDICDYEEANFWKFPNISYDELLSIVMTPFPCIIDTLQIPDHILHCTSTEKLIDLCLQFPFNHDYFGFWIYMRDVNPCGHYLYKILLPYNGTKALYTRKDAMYCLLKRYNEEIHFYLENGGSEIENLNNPLFSNLPAIEIMLTHLEIQDEKKTKEILQNLVYGYEAIISKGDILQSEMIPNFWARANIIVKICDQCLLGGKNNIIFYTPITNGVHISEAADIINRLSYQLIE